MNKAKFNQNSGKDLPGWAIGPFVEHKKNPALQPSRAGWDRGAVWNPPVIVENDKFYMLYRGAVAVGGGFTMVLLRNLLLWQQHQNRNRLGIRKANDRKGRVLGLLGVGECNLVVRPRAKLGLTNATGLPVGIWSPGARFPEV